MALTELHVSHLRNLLDQRLQFSPFLNLIDGPNGSGKTSLLEAIYYLSAGRSFRTRKHRHVVSHGQQEMTVFARVENARGEQRLGIRRDLVRGETALRKNGLTVRSIAEFARELPVSVIEPGTFNLVAGGPGQRRQFLDWLVFHVEHEFGPLWQEVQKAISQRNHCLRHGILRDGQIKVWSVELARLSVALTERREYWFARFRERLLQLLDSAGADWAADLSLEFYRGWDNKRDLADLLTTPSDAEIRAGYTLYGPNRCDIRIRLDQHSAAETLSRGQQRTLVILMKLAQMAVVHQHTGGEGICLIDDMNAELDQGNRELLARELLGLGCQLFVTSIEPADPDQLWAGAGGQTRMFHVEHGQFSEQQSGQCGSL